MKPLIDYQSKIKFRDIQYVLVGPILNSSQIEWLKWIAIITMALGHGYELFGYTGLLFFEISRITYPLFAFILVYNYIHHARDAKRYLSRILIFAILAEAPYQHFFVRDVYLANILFVLGSGLLTIYVIDRLIEFQKDPEHDVRKAWAAWYILGIFVLCVGFFVDYMHLGIFICIAYWGWLRFPSYATFYAAVVATFLVNLPIGLDYSAVGLLAFPIIALIAWLPIKIPRINKWFFYSFYPLHIIVFDIIRHLSV